MLYTFSARVSLRPGQTEELQSQLIYLSARQPSKHRKKSVTEITSKTIREFYVFVKTAKKKEKFLLFIFFSFIHCLPYSAIKHKRAVSVMTK